MVGRRLGTRNRKKKTIFGDESPVKEQPSREEGSSHPRRPAGTRKTGDDGGEGTKGGKSVRGRPRSPTPPPLSPVVSESATEETDETVASPPRKKAASTSKAATYRPGHIESATEDVASPRRKSQHSNTPRATSGSTKCSTPKASSSRRTQCTPRSVGRMRPPQTPRTPRTPKTPTASKTPRTPRTPKTPLISAWTSEREEQLCDLWRDAPFMYNKRHPNYKNNTKRIYTKVKWAAQLDVTGKLTQNFDNRNSAIDNHNIIAIRQNIPSCSVVNDG